MPLTDEQRQALDAAVTGVPIQPYAPSINTLPEPDPYAERRPRSVLGWGMDILARGQYAMAGMADVLVDEGVTSFGKALVVGAEELLVPKRRRSFRDVMETASPEWVANNPKKATTLGLIGDIGLDPTTYLTFGAGAATRLSLKGVGTGAAKLAARKEAQRALKRQVAKLASDPKVDLEAAMRQGKAVSEKVFKRELENSETVVALNKIGERQLNEFSELQILRDEANRMITMGADPNEALEMARRSVEKHYIDPADLISSQEVAMKRFADMLSVGNLEDTVTIADDVRLGRAAGRRLQRQGANLAGGKQMKVSDLIDKGGVRLGGKEILSGDAWAKVKNVVGLTRLQQAAKTSFNDVHRLFSRHLDVPEHLVDLERKYNVELADMEREVRSVTKRIFGDLNGKSRQKLGQVAARIDDEVGAIREADRALGMADDAGEAAGKQGPMTGGTADEIASARERILADAKLSPEEHSAFIQMHQTFQELGMNEVQAGILGKMKEHYFPRYYKNFESIRHMLKLRRMSNKGMSEWFSHDEARMFANLDEAKAAGYNPVLDAGEVLAMRVMQSHRALAKTHFNDAVQREFPWLHARSGQVLAKEAAGDLPKNATAIQRYVQFVGDGLYSRTTAEEMNSVIGRYDRAMQWFRRSATVLRPAFGVRNFMSNLGQSFLVGGHKALRHLIDPRSMTDAALMLQGKAGKFGLTTALGRHYSGEELFALSREFNITRNIAFEGVGGGPINSMQGVRKVVKELDQARMGRKVFGESAAGKGLFSVLKNSMNYTNIPAAIEDYARTSMFVNMIRQGHMPKRAAQMVDEALFDYTGGLSQFESRWARRIVPFYSFQRFAIPMVAKAATHTPGRVVNQAKVAKAVMEAWHKHDSDRTLTPSERAALPGWLIEQPHLVRGFDEEMRAKFHTFNNFSPLDVFSFIEGDENSRKSGKIDMQKTLVNAFLAQLTPVLKIPLERGIGRNLFSGRELKKDGPKQSLKQINTDELLGNLLGAALATAAPTGAGTAKAAGNILGDMLSVLTPEAGKRKIAELIGLEKGIDPYTGKEVTYVSPYQVHMLTSALPGFNDAIKSARKLDDDEETPLVTTMRFLFGGDPLRAFGGVPTVNLDLQQEANRRRGEIKRRGSDIKARARRALREQRHNSFLTAQDDLKEWITDAQADFEALEGGQRGPTDLQ